MTASDKLILAAHLIEEKGEKFFSAEELVVTAWKKFPETFSLTGFDYPDSNRVLSEIMGSKSIRKKGLIKKIGKKMYQLTEMGNAYANNLLSKKNPIENRNKFLTREISQILKRLYSSRAFEKFIKKEVSEITFFDACSFWGISPRSSAIDFEGRITNIINVIESSQKILQGEMDSSDSMEIVNLDNLKALHYELLKKFSNEIEIIKKRTDERK